MEEHEEYEERPRRSRSLISDADQIVDELLPEDLDWRHLVTTYPRTSLAVSAVAGFFVGRRQGMSLLAALSGFVVGEVTRNVQEFVEDLSS